MKKLHPLSPIGLGTANVESLVSYLIRLASSHTTSIGILLEFLEASSPGIAPGWEKVARRLRLSSHIRPNQTTSILADLLSNATGLPLEALRSMSFLGLTGALRRSTSAFLWNISWCPACFREWRKSGVPSHLKLSWHARLMTHCEVHRCALSCRCPGCGTFQTSYEMWDSVDTCCKKGCKSFLGDGPLEDLSDSWEDSAPEVRSLISHISANPETAFPRHGMRQSLRVLKKEMGRAGCWENFRDQLALCTRRDIEFKKCDSLTLLKAVEISRAAGVDLPELLLGSIKYSNRRLLLLGTNPNPPARPPIRRRRLGSRERLRSKIEAFLRSRPERPPTLREVAAHVRASVGGLQYRLPGLCKDIVERHRQDALVQKQIRSSELDVAIRSLLGRWSPALDGALSRKALLRRLMVDPRWSKNLIRERVKSYVPT